MAKKETKSETHTAPAAPATNPAGETNAKQAGASKPFGKEPNGADVFTRCLGPDGKPTPLQHKNTKGEVVPLSTPQVKVIANLLETALPGGMTRKELVEKLPIAGLITRQPVGRIVSYYQKSGVDNGIWAITKGAPAPVAAPTAA